jgi:hypothetical protein
MFRRILQGRVSRSIALLGAISYASVGLFGYGLHSLWHCEHAAHAVEGTTERHSCCGHSHDHAPPSEGSSLSSTHDDCSICSLLAQAQTSVVPLVALEGAEPVTLAGDVSHGQVPLVPVESFQARGPPLS